MKKYVKIPAVIVVTILIMSMLAGSVTAQSLSSQVNLHKPVKAENVEIVKKITLKGPAVKPSTTSRLASTGIVGDPVKGKRYAIVVGINNYPGTVNDLLYAARDAIAMTNVLTSKYEFDSNNIQLITDEKATRSAIFGAVKALKSNIITADDELVFFFSGHGAKGKADDGDRSNVDQSIVVCNEAYNGFDLIWDGELKALFEDFPTNRIIFIFDSCLSGGMSVLKGTDRVVNMACTANGLSYEGSWGDGHGQFTYYFAIDGMGMKAANGTLDTDNATDEEAFDYAKENCVWQTPTIADTFSKDLMP